MKNDMYGKCSPRHEQKTKVGDTLMLDQQPSGDGRLEPSVENKITMDDRAQKAIFGYARLDLIVHETELRFGTWNPRPLKADQVSRLVQSFLTKGADRFSYAKAIPLVVSKTDVKEGTYAKTYEPGSDTKPQLPLLQVADGAKGKRALIAAGGQHRLKAVIQWTKTLTKQYEELVKERRALEEQDSETVALEEVQHENKTRKPKRDGLQKTLALGGQWIVVLYDTGKPLCPSLVSRTTVARAGMRDRHTRHFTHFWHLRKCGKCIAARGSQAVRRRC